MTDHRPATPAPTSPLHECEDCGCEIQPDNEYAEDGLCGACQWWYAGPDEELEKHDE